MIKYPARLINGHVIFHANGLTSHYKTINEAKRANRGNCNHCIKYSDREKYPPVQP
jgi:hypothetical protein